MVDSAEEELLTLTQAADRLPRRRRGKKTNTSTLYRWSTTGCRGVVLETIQIGATRCTSREALQRFFEGLTPGKVVPRPIVTEHPTVAAMSRRSEAASKRLQEMGA